MTSHPSQEAKINNNIKKIWKNVSLFFSSSSLTSSEEWHAPFESEWRVPPRAPSPHRRYWPEKYIYKKKTGTAQQRQEVESCWQFHYATSTYPGYVCVCVLFISQERRCKKETEEEEGNFYRFHSKMVPASCFMCCFIIPSGGYCTNP